MCFSFILRGIYQTGNYRKILSILACSVINPKDNLPDLLLQERKILLKVEHCKYDPIRKKKTWNHFLDRDSFAKS